MLRLTFACLSMPQVMLIRLSPAGLSGCMQRGPWNRAPQPITSYIGPLAYLTHDHGHRCSFADPGLQAFIFRLGRVKLE
jgi:hypothetical protein